MISFYMLIKNAKFRVFLYPYSNFLLHFFENDLNVPESMIFRKAHFILSSFYLP